jgi:trk system potassium uptake protein
MNILMRYLGYIILISASSRIIPIFAGVIYGESIFLFTVSLLISVVLGLLLLLVEKIFIKEGSKYSLSQLDLPNAMILICLSFIILSIFGSISFLSSFNYNFWNALFESVSGFTTTGMTLYNSLEGLPKSLLLWRAQTQWIGGIGIIVVFLFIISRLRYRGREEETQIESTASLYQAQGFQEKLEPSLTKSSKNVLIIYGGYTLLGIILLYFTGMSLFESISLSFTSLSTGGFIVTDNLQASNIQLVILSVLMLLGSISFITHNELLAFRFKNFLRSFEKNIFLTVLFGCVLLTFAVSSDVKLIFFELISAFTTTGYSLTSISLLPPLFVMLVMTGMVVGGSIASTSGGMKISRVYSFLRMVPWMLKKLSSPRHAIIPLRIKKQTVDEKDQLIVVVFVTLFLMVLFTGTLIFLLLGYGLLDSSFQMASAIGTVGLQSIDLMAVPLLGKIVLMIAMLLGRLEIFPVMIMLRKFFKFFSNSHLSNLKSHLFNR